MSFDRCNFINTEINHDLSPPMTIKEHKTFFLKSRNNSGVCRAATGDLNLFDDFAIVEKISGLKFEKIKKNDWTNLQYNPITLTGNVSGNLKKYHKPYNNSLFKLFPDNINDLFFIIDTGDNLIQLLKGFTPSKPINIHVIHSVLTLADSAPKTLPDSSNYNSNNTSVNLFSWYYSIPILIPQNDQLFMSSFNINNQINGTGWKIRQDWKNGEDLLYQPLDAKKENTKIVVRAYLKTHIDKKDIGSNSNSINDSLNIQKKRSGDYFQIWIANKFPKYAKYTQNNFVHVRGPSKEFPYIQNEEQCRKQTYFITGDWPAFAAAIYNKVNCIMVFKHPTKVEESFTICAYF